MFRVGDEVTVIRHKEKSDGGPAFSVGAAYVVEGVIIQGPQTGLVIEGMHSEHPTKAYDAAYFRKVERRNDSLSIEAFLTIKSGFEEPRRTNQPAKRKEQA